MAETVDRSDRDDRRKGRGRLSTIEMLPEECDEDIAWANMALREKKMPQTEILRQFNARLADRGIKGISKGSFSRYSIRLAVETRKMEASRQIMDVVMARLEPGERSDSMIAATELLKYRILEQVMAEDEPDPKLLLNASLMLQRLSSTAAREAEVQRREKREQREEDERAAEAEAEALAREEQEAAEQVKKIGGEAGLTAERIDAITRGVLKLAS